MVRYQILTVISALSSVITLAVMLATAAIIHAMDIPRPEKAAVFSVLGIGIGWVLVEALYRWAVVFRGKMDY